MTPEEEYCSECECYGCAIVRCIRCPAIPTGRCRRQDCEFDDGGEE